MRFIGLPRLLAVTVAWAFCSGVLGASETKRIELVPSAAPHNEVRYQIEVGGELVFEHEKEATQRKLSVVAELQYDELCFDKSEAPDGVVRTVRRYSKANAAIKIGDGGRKTELRPSRRIVAVELDGSKTTLFSPDGPLTRPELDLIETVAGSRRIEGLLPDKAIAEGDSWALSKEFVAGFLDLDAVVEADITCKVTEITDDVVRFQLTGEVEGAKLGVITQLAVKGKYRFDRRLGAVDWLGLLVKEQRPMGHVTHGLDVVARIQLRIIPSEGDAGLDEKTLADKTFGVTPEAARIMFEPNRGEWNLEHDRRWHVNLNQHDLAVFRLLDHGKFIAQCNVTPLKKVEPGKQATLKDFQREIELMLDDRASGFLDAGQWASDKDYRILRTTVAGEAEGSSIQWRYYLVTDRHGRQVTFAFTVESDLVDALGEADRRFVESLTFTPPEVAMKENADSTEAAK